MFKKIFKTVAKSVCKTDGHRWNSWTGRCNICNRKRPVRRRR